MNSIGKQLSTLLRSTCTGVAFVCAGLALATSAAAQTVYNYTGNPFTQFSCGGGSICATGGPNANTSYSAADVVTAKLELSAPLAPNLAFQDISGLAGFRLTLEDRHQVMVATAGYAGGVEAKVSTDSEGRIIGPWSLIVNCCAFPNNGVASLNNPGGRGVADSGILSAPSGSFPTTALDSGYRFANPGSWALAPPTPAGAVTALITLINANGLGLTNGQVMSFTDALNGVLASIEAGQNRTAIRQLKSFIRSVESAQRKGTITAEAAATLIAAANAIIAML